MKNNKNFVVKKECHSRGMLYILSYCRYKKSVILDLIQDLPRLFSTRGFTLIELLVVVLIIGILAAVAVPQYQIAVKKAGLARYIPLVDALYKAEQVYYLEHGEYADNLDKLDISMPVTSECIRTTVAEDKDRYKCNNETMQIAIADHVTNVQAGYPAHLLYIKFLKDYPYTALDYIFQEGKSYCFAKDDIAKKVCKALGGQEIGSSEYYTYYLLP